MSMEQCVPEKKNESRHVLLKARARELAQEEVKTDIEQEFLDVIIFRLASETYGIESAYVREVYPLKDFTPLPGTPPFVLGIINVRGQIISVVDPKKFFDLPDKGLAELNKVVIIRNEKMEFGILVDVVLDTVSIPVEAIQSPLPTTTGISAAYVEGVTGDRLIILDAEGILGDEHIIVNEEVRSEV